MKISCQNSISKYKRLEVQYSKMKAHINIGPTNNSIQKSISKCKESKGLYDEILQNCYKIQTPN
jgi:hypothetical protein